MTQICRVCGCTNFSACAGGCWWVDDDLCSTCGSGPTRDAAEPTVINDEALAELRHLANQGTLLPLPIQLLDHIDAITEHHTAEINAFVEHHEAETADMERRLTRHGCTVYCCEDDAHDGSHNPVAVRSHPLYLLRPMRRVLLEDALGRDRQA